MRIKSAVNSQMFELQTSVSIIAITQYYIKIIKEIPVSNIKQHNELFCIDENTWKLTTPEAFYIF